VDKSKFGRVCSETIYRFIYDRRNREMALYILLAKRRRSRCGQRGRKPRGSHIPLYCNIKHRPKDIATREAFGHWEADLVIFRRDFGKANITRPPKITLMPLPSNAPELNPVENLWQFMRHNWLSNRVFTSYDDIVDLCCEA
jgi:hypothetical protein